MKKHVSLFILCCFVFNISISQVGIGTNAPDASAILDLATTNYGFLPPRLTEQQRNNIPNPAAGLIVWCTDCGASGELQVFNGTNWTNIVGGAAAPWSCGNPFVDIRDLISYTTVLIGTQCWMAENLNVGTRINGISNQTDNGILEKYCYDDLESNCNIYGGLYQWDEMMQYSTQQGTQGICPPGWHIPTDEEWMILEGTVDSQYGVGDPVWNNVEWRGFDAGKNLKSTSGWYSNGNGTDLYGFAALPGGTRDYDGFYALGNNGVWWSSTEISSSHAWHRNLYYDFDDVSRYPYAKTFGFSLRCLKDN